MRKLFFISGNNYIRNYVETGVLHAIRNGSSLPVAIESDVAISEKLASELQICGRFKYEANAVFAHDLLFKVLMLTYRRRSTAFAFRYRREWDYLATLWRTAVKVGQSTSQVPFGNLLPRFVRELILVRKSNPDYFLRVVKQSSLLVFARLMSLPGLSALFRLLFDQCVRPNADVEKIIAATRPDLIIIPTNAYEPLLNDVHRLRRKHGYRTFLLVDNWDNLSSKTVFAHPVDYIGVWGQQSVDQSISIHGIAPSAIFKLGTPRFDGYERLIREMAAGKPQPSPVPFEYVLFTGCSIAFDETTALEHLDRACARWNEQTGEQLKIIYRHHPWRLTRKQEVPFDPRNFKHVVPDQQLRNYKRKKREARSVVQPDLNYYPPLLANARFVVGPLTTMLLEAALFRKAILALAYDDGIHLTSPHNAYRFYPHFQGIERIPGLSLIHQLNDLESSFIRTCEMKHYVPDPKLHEQAIAQFLHRDEKSYVDRLTASLAEIEAREP